MKIKSPLYFSLLSIFAIFVTWCFLHLAQYCYFADSEIWLLTLSQNILKYEHLSSIPYKIGFHGLTYLFSYFAPTEWDVYIYARTGWSLIALITQFILAGIFTVAFNKKKFFLPVFISLITFSAFFNQGFRVRGDTLSLFSHSLILLILLGLKNSSIRWWHYIAIFSLNILLLASTPKSIYFYIIQFVFFSYLCKSLSLKTHFLRLLWITHVLPIFLICAVALSSLVFSIKFNLISAIQGALDFYLKTYDGHLGNTSFFSLNDFTHILKALLLSPVHALIFLAGTLLVIIQLFSKEKPRSNLNIYFGVLLLLILFHNQKLPFFIGTYGSPLIGFTSIVVFIFFEEYTPKLVNLFTLILCGAMCLFCSLQYSENLKLNNNLAQSISVGILDQYLQKYPKTTVYDVIGLLPRKTNIFIFIGPSETSRKKEIIKQINDANPDIILLVYKFIFLEPDIVSYLTRERITTEPHVWIKGDYFSVTKTMSYFRTARKIKNEYYWTIPHKPKKYIFELTSQESIRSEVLYFKNGVPTDSFKSADAFAIPQKYLAIVQTDTAPIFFLHNPFGLFRFDTSF